MSSIRNKKRGCTLGAPVSLSGTPKPRELVVKLKAEADELDARIKHVAEMEEKGFWLCENGHESEKVGNNAKYATS
jgi:hypothetical protein